MRGLEPSVRSDSILKGLDVEKEVVENEAIWHFLKLIIVTLFEFELF